MKYKKGESGQGVPKPLEGDKSSQPKPLQPRVKV